MRGNAELLAGGTAGGNSAVEVNLKLNLLQITCNLLKAHWVISFPCSLALEQTRGKSKQKLRDLIFTLQSSTSAVTDHRAGK